MEIDPEFQQENSQWGLSSRFFVKCLGRRSFGPLGLAFCHTSLGEDVCLGVSIPPGVVPWPPVWWWLHLVPEGATLLRGKFPSDKKTSGNLKNKKNTRQTKISSSDRFHEKTSVNVSSHETSPVRHILLPVLPLVVSPLAAPRYHQAGWPVRSHQELQALELCWFEDWARNEASQKNHTYGYTHSIHGTGIFTYIAPWFNIKINQM